MAMFESRTTEERAVDVLSNPVPLQMGTADEFALVAGTLRRASFDEKSICEVFGLSDMSDVGHLTIADVERAEASEQLKVLARLFLVLTVVPHADVEKVFSDDVIKAFRSLGLLERGEPGDNFYSTVLLAPVQGFLIASDRLINPDGSPLVEMPDIVFPAIYQGTLQFLRLLPRLEGRDVLDLCAGTGIAAFALSRTSRRAVSIDITGRASVFASFNKAINGCENVEVLQGDLYKPVSGQQFDCIVAHPPYVPSLSLDTFWRDGGSLGDVLIQRIIQEMPAYLRPDGCALILAQGVDTQEGKFEERARQWLGQSANQFDIIFAGEKDRGPRRVLELLGRKTPGDVIDQLRDAFNAAGVENMPYGALFFRRKERSPEYPAWMIRARLSSETAGPDFQTTFAMHDVVSRDEFRSELTQAAPYLAPHLEVTVTHVVQDGSLMPAQYVCATKRPFAKRVLFDDWAIELFMRFDGQTTVEQIYRDSRANSAMPEEFTLDDFVLLTTRAIEAGFLILPEKFVAVAWST